MLLAKRGQWAIVGSATKNTFLKPNLVDFLGFGLFGG